MGILIHIHRTHRQFTQGRDRIEVKGTTVGECLQEAISQYPGVANVLFYKDGGLRNHVEIYLNAESAYPDELEKLVSEGDEITITALLAGG